jgi:LmbE family N-acetylglucosaminyl deacetylase
MLGFAVPVPGGRPLEVSVLGAHAHDIEIGCGGNHLALTGREAPVRVTWVVLSAAGERERETRLVPVGAPHHIFCGEAGA